MAEDEDIESRSTLHDLLIAIKTTSEGLLATNTTNVWNTYGGLTRQTQAVENILNHGLRVVQNTQGSSLDYWNFIKGLRWLCPVLAPSIEHINKTTYSSTTSKGQEWITQSLQNHSLSSQLKILVQNRSHLDSHYYAHAFLCNPEYFEAFFLCLQAVEQNTVSILAEIDPKLIRPDNTKPKRISHVRSSSLPTNPIEMPRRPSSDRLAPPLTMSPKSESVLTLSDDHALPCSIGSSPDSAKEALMTVLEKDGSHVFDNETSFSLYTRVHSDPLMNLEFHLDPDMPLKPIDFTTRTARTTLKRSQSAINTASVAKSTKNDKTRKYLHSTSSLPDGIQDKKVMPKANEDVSKSVTRQQSLLDNILNCDDIDKIDGLIGEANRTSTPSNDFSQEDSGLADSVGSIPVHIKNQNNAQDSEMNNNSSSDRTKSKSKKISHVRSRSDYGTKKQKPLLEEQGNQSDDTLVESVSLSSSLPTGNLKRRPSLLEDGGSSISQITECYFPRPTQGQSLINFLESQDFHTCAELDKENAHFTMSEALIAAIEQMKWNQVLRPPQASDDEGDSDEEIQELKQRIRIRRRERMKEKAKVLPGAFSDGTGTTTTSTSSVLSSDHESSDFSDDESSSEEIDDEEIEEQSSEPKSNLMSLQEQGLSLSLGSLYSDADLKKSTKQHAQLERNNSILDTSSSSYSYNMSAESVAISLLKKFSENQLPKASDLEWLVSEKDAPQELLPLPNSWPVSPDDNENEVAKRTRLRGNNEWAPPRAQIIFIVHQTPKRKVQLARQNHRCAGCGTRVEPGFIKRFRYCEYLGKYFCQCCHSNATSFIPGKILQKWDFTKYYVSNFARDLLSKMYNDPLFNVQDINPALYRKVRVLDSVGEARLQLFDFKRFLQACRLGVELLNELENQPAHWFSDIHLYSLHDLVQVKENKMHLVLKQLVLKCFQHVNSCPLCQAKGFICELCNNDKEILFPFEVHKVTKCPACRACFHKVCYIPNKCPRCARIEARKIRLTQTQLSAESPS